MQPNWQQQQYGYGGGQGFGGGQGGPGGPGSFMQSQPTGFGMQRPMQTGFGGAQQQPRPMNNMSTGGSGGNMSFLNNPPPSSFGSGGMNPQITGYPGGGASGLMSQQTGFSGGGGMMSQPTGFGGGGLMSQPTGMGGGFGGLRAQPTGIQDPRLQSMMQTFMPMNTSQPFTSSGVPQFNQPPQQQPLTQTFQSLLSNPSVKTPKVPWTLSKQEKKDYDQIFRAWEKGDGFISGETAREVFGQSGLGQDDLMKIWTLSDIDNRGKLNLPEFHVAMGMIYRALNGNEIPDTLPAELVPASMRDIDTTVNFMRDLLKHEASSRSNTTSPSLGGGGTSNYSSRDATAYKHDDSRSSTYKPSSRHLDRKAVRYAGEDSDADIKDIRRQLQNTSALLDSSNDDYGRKTEEDEQLEQEVEDLKYRVRRLQEDIDYVSKGRRSAEKDEERRKLERELLFLMHEKLPELERRQSQREEERRMDERAGVRARDKRNQTHGRYDDRDDRDRDRDWLRGTYDNDRRGGDRDREYYGGRDSRDRSRERRYDDDRYRDRSRERDRDRSYNRPRTPPRDRSPPPPAPPPASTSTSSAPPPPPPAPTAKPATGPDTKKMTPEERSAYIRAQAQARIQERLRALGVESAPADAPTVDKSVEDRLEQEKKEAEAKSKEADEEQEKREQARRARLAGVVDTPTDEKPPTTAAKSPPAPPTPKSILKKGGPPPAPTSRGTPKQAPPPPASRGVAATPPAPTPPAEDPEEAELKRREEAMAKAKEDRRKRLAAMEAEEAEEARKEAEAATSRSVKSPAGEAPPPPPAPPAPAAPSSGGGYNPFRKPGGAGSGAAASPAVSTGGSFNPFFKPQAAQTPAPAVDPAPSEAPEAPAPPPPPPPPPAAPPAPILTSRSAAADDEWEQIEEKDDDSDSSDDDDDYATSRDHRRNLASALFGNLGGGSPTSGSRPGSAGAGSSAPKADPAALKNLGGGDPSQGMGALLSSIQGGKSLRKTQTVVKGEATGGKVIGDAAPPSHINLDAQPRESTGQDEPPSPAPPAPSMPGSLPMSSSPEPTSNANDLDADFTARNANRGSVDWYAGLAADQAHPGASFGDTSVLEPTPEELDDNEDGERGMNGEQPANGDVPGIKVDEDLSDFDMTTSKRVRTVFAYEGQREVDLSFKEDVVIIAHPAKDAESPWWYGMTVDGGSKGWFPHNYVEEIHATKAKALYSYTGNSEEELPFAEGDTLDIVDQSDENWWKAEKAGMIFIVPAAYLELTADATPGNPQVNPAVIDIPPSQPDPAARSSNLLPPMRPDVSRLQSMDDQPGRSRSSTIGSIEDDGYESSDDSVLSWWSSDEDDSDASIDEEKEAERKRREDERKKILSVAGLQLRREPPAVPPSSSHAPSSSKPVARKPTVGRRRPAPAAPKKRRRAAPAVPKHEVETTATEDSDIILTPGEQSDTEAKSPATEEPAQDPEAATLDAYARYEQFLASSRNKPATTGPTPVRIEPLNRNSTISPQLTGASSPGHHPSQSLSPSSSQLTLPGHTASSGGGKISSFFSKMMTPTPGEGGAEGKRSTPRISGPITKIDLPSRPDTPASGGGAGTPGGADIGKTWSSLVDEGVLKSMSDQERKRQEAIFEFIATEAAYNRDLQLIVEVFYASLLELLDEKALTVIFANIEDILLANTSFLSSLEQRQKSCRLYIDVIGDILQQHMPSMSVYTPYCVNQNQAGKLLQSVRQSNSELQTHLQSIRESNTDVRGLDLSSFLLIPMQRITRYPLLLKQIIHYTTSETDLRPLQNALMTVEDIVATINESVRENEMHERLRELSEDLWIGGEGRLDLTAPTQYQGPRRLLKEGTVTKSKSGRKLTLVLCNDILVLIESRNLYRMPMPLFELTVRPGLGRDESSFTLKIEFHRGRGDSIGLKAPNAREAKEWMSIIEWARMDSIQARQKSGILNQTMMAY